MSLEIEFFAEVVGYEFVFRGGVDGPGFVAFLTLDLVLGALNIVESVVVVAELARLVAAVL